MKKLICVVALCLSSPCSFADEASVQKVLDSVHGKGFVGCDTQIREAFTYDTISHVETKMPFQSPYEKGKLPVTLRDEVVVIVDTIGHAEYDWKGGVTSVIFRKVGNQCISAFNFAVQSSIRRDCAQYSKDRMSSATLVAETDGSKWMRMELGGKYDEVSRKQGAKEIFTPLPTGGCRLIVLPEDSSPY